MVEMKTTEGEIGVLAGHIPLTAILEPGVLRIKQEENVREAALHDGFVEIQKDRVTVLAESCEWPDEIDVERANEAKERAERRIKSGKAKYYMAQDISMSSVSKSTFSKYCRNISSYSSADTLKTFSFKSAFLE